MELSFDYFSVPCLIGNIGFMMMTIYTRRRRVIRPDGLYVRRFLRVVQRQAAYVRRITRLRRR